MEGSNINQVSGTTMSAGVVSTISHRGAGPSMTERGGSKGEPDVSASNKIASITEHRSSGNPVERVWASQSEVVQKETSKPSQKGKKELADNLFETAKEEGVDAAFEKLANGNHGEPKTDRRLDDGPVGDKNNSSNTVEDKNTTDEEVKEIKTGDQSRFESKEQFISPIEMQVRQLESQISKLMEQNKDLAKKADEAQAMAKAGITTALELAQVLKALIEGEEEEKKKQHEGLLAILARLIAQMLIMITVPEDQQEKAMEGINQKSQHAQAA